MFSLFLRSEGSCYTEPQDAGSKFEGHIIGMQVDCQLSSMFILSKLFTLLIKLILKSCVEHN